MHSAYKVSIERRVAELGVLYACVFFLSAVALDVPQVAVLIAAFGFVVYVARCVMLRRVGVIALLFALALGLFVVHAAVSGGFVLSSLLSTRFYDGEGRLLLAYLPLFAFFAVPEGALTHSNIERIAKFLFFVSLCLLPVYAFGYSAALHGSHHAAGFASASICIVMYSLWAQEQRTWQFAGMIVAAVLLLFANSRSSILAFLLAYLARNLGVFVSPKRLALLGLVLVSLVGFWSQASPYTFARFQVLLEPQLYRDIIAQIDLSSGVGIEATENTELTGGNYNVLTRIRLWVRAVGIFLESPLFGMGAFRFNDPIETYRSLVPGVAVFETRSIDISVFTAHNSYFQLLSEVGLIGTLVFLLPWGMSFLILARTEVVRAMPIQRALREIGMLHVLFVSAGAIAGHLLAAPSALYWCLPWMVLALRFQSSGQVQRATE